MLNRIILDFKLEYLRNKFLRGGREGKVNVFLLLWIQCSLLKFIVFFILLISAHPALNIGITVHHNMLYSILENTPKISKSRDQGKQTYSPPPK